VTIGYSPGVVKRRCEVPRAPQ